MKNTKRMHGSLNRKKDNLSNKKNVKLIIVCVMHAFRQIKR